MELPDVPDPDPEGAIHAGDPRPCALARISDTRTESVRSSEAPTAPAWISDDPTAFVRISRESTLLAGSTMAA